MEIDGTQLTGVNDQPVDNEHARPIDEIDDPMRPHRDPVPGHGELERRDPPWPPADDPEMDEPEKKAPGVEEPLKTRSYRDRDPGYPGTL